MWKFLGWIISNSFMIISFLNKKDKNKKINSVVSVRVLINEPFIIRTVHHKMQIKIESLRKKVKNMREFIELMLWWNQCFFVLANANYVCVENIWFGSWLSANYAAIFKFIKSSKNHSDIFFEWFECLLNKSSSCYKMRLHILNTVIRHWCVD